MLRVFKNVEDFHFLALDVVELFFFEMSCVSLIVFCLKDLIKAVVFQITSSISKEELILVKSNEINVTF